MAQRHLKNLQAPGSNTVTFTQSWTSHAVSDFCWLPRALQLSPAMGNCFYRMIWKCTVGLSMTELPSTKNCWYQIPHRKVQILKTRILNIVYFSFTAVSNSSSGEDLSRASSTQVTWEERISNQKACSSWNNSKRNGDLSLTPQSLKSFLLS